MADVTPAADCSTMTEVRREIDRIDRAIVALLAQRMGYIAAAGRIKADRGTVRDEARKADVKAKVMAEAERLGFPPALASDVYEVLIEGSIAHEFTVWDDLRQAPDAPRLSPAAE
jgi:isochorismate pyruvate lyase